MSVLNLLIGVVTLSYIKPKKERKRETTLLWLLTDCTSQPFFSA